MTMLDWAFALAAILLAAAVAIQDRKLRRLHRRLLHATAERDAVRQITFGHERIAQIRLETVAALRQLAKRR
jgi:hypothetical protein